MHKSVTIKRGGGTGKLSLFGPKLFKLELYAYL